MTQNIPEIFDNTQLVRQKERALKQGTCHQFLHEEAAHMIGEHLACMKRDISHTLNLYAFNPYLHSFLQQQQHISSLQCYGALPTLSESLQSYHHIPLDTPLPTSNKPFDLITSSMSLHWINDLPGLLIQTRQLLKKDGLLLFNLLGAGTLDELRISLAEADKIHYGGIAARVIPFVEVKALGMLLQRAGFEMPVTDTETITVHYPNLVKLMHDLRYMGEGNALLKRSNRPISKGWLKTAEDHYRAHFSDGDGGISARFEIITATALAPS